MSEEQASQSLETPQEVEKDADTEALYESFGMPQQQSMKDVDFPNMDEPTDPATAQEDEFEKEESAQLQEARKYKIKFNKEEIEVDESQVPELLEKGMALDKTRAKLTEQQKALDEIAQLQGFKDHDDLIANLPKLREQQAKKAESEYNQLRAELRQQAEDAGLDPDKVEAYLDNHPLMKEAQQVKEQRQIEQMESAKKQQEQEWKSKWDELYQSFPDLAETAKAFQEGKDPEWYNADMKSRIEKGYDPVDAYRLAHSDKLQTQTKRATEQKLIKQQQLGLRGHVNEQTATPPDEGSLLPAQIALAEEFGVDIKGVQRQNQILKSRR